VFKGAKAPGEGIYITKKGYPQLPSSVGVKSSLVCFNNKSVSLSFVL
jgi:hypothetical protein